MAVLEPSRTGARSTHEVLNQPPRLEGYNLYLTDQPLMEAVQREGAGWAEPRITALGEVLGGEPLEWGRLAEEYPPVLHTHDRYGNRIDEVEFHESWHKMLALGVEHGLHSLPWNEPVPGAV